MISKLGVACMTFLIIAPQCMADAHGCVGSQCNGGWGVESDDDKQAAEHLLQISTEVNDALKTSASQTTNVTKLGNETGDPSHLSDLKELGPAMNSDTDFWGFVLNVVITSLMSLGWLIAFRFLSEIYPIMYSHNSQIGLAPPIQDTPLGWYRATSACSIEQTADNLGLDCALLLLFCDMCKEICFKMGLPMLCIMGLLHKLAGGEPKGPIDMLIGGAAAGRDALSYFSMGNVVYDKWLFWIHGFIVWAVCYLVVSIINRFNSSRFLFLRRRWLNNLTEPQTTTVMVENIPEQYRADADLKNFFSRMFPVDGSSVDKVKEAYVAKDTRNLVATIAKRDALQYKIDEAEAKLRIANGAEANEKDDIAKYYEERGSLEKTMMEQKNVVLRESLSVGGLNMSTGFVTFNSGEDAYQALSLIYSEDALQWTVSAPPNPETVIWQDLVQSGHRQLGRIACGYALILGLVLGYTPIILAISNYAKMIYLGPLQPIWVSVAPTLGLFIMTSFLPTILNLILSNFFILKFDGWAQKCLQNWCFVFDFLFVVLVTAIGDNFIQVVATIAKSPRSGMQILATSMPHATHFYMNYIVLLNAAHCKEMVRLFNLLKFRSFKLLFDEEKAKEMAEPEDQDYYGMGARSSRTVIEMVITLVFGTLTPVIGILGLVNFWIRRLTFGYLLNFAETKKPDDLGGEFWISMMDHLYVGLVTYVILMAGFLQSHHSSSGPAIIAGIAIFYVIWSWIELKQGFRWQKLTFPEVCQRSAKKASNSGMKYRQPELQ